MSIATELSRIRDAKDAIRAAIIDKGVNVPAAAKIDTYADRIDEIVQTASGNMEVVTANPSGTINAVDNRFYMLSGDAAALVFNLPAMQQGGYGIYLLMTTASTSVVTFSSADSSQIVFPSGFQVEADKCYLMNFDYVNSQWQVGVISWFKNNINPDMVTIETISTAVSTLSAQVGKYYKFTQNVGTLEVTLPTVTSSIVQGCVLYFTTGTTPSVTFASADSSPIEYFKDYAIEASKTYELNCMFNGTKWTIAYATID